MDLETLSTLKREAQRWRKLQDSSSRLRKKNPDVQPDFTSNPCCTPRQRMDALEFKRKRRPSMRLKDVLGEEALRELSLRKTREAPLRPREHHLVNPRTVTFGHRPGSASLHYSALTVDETCKNMQLPRAGILSVRELHGVLQSKTRDKTQPPRPSQKSNTSRLNKSSSIQSKKQPWDGTVYQPIMDTLRKGQRPQKMEVNALMGRQRKKLSYGPSSTRPSKSPITVLPHPFCTHRQEADLKRRGQPLAEFRAHIPLARRYLGASCIHSTTPRLQASLQSEAAFLLGIHSAESHITL